MNETEFDDNPERRLAYLQAQKVAIEIEQMRRPWWRKPSYTGLAFIPSFLAAILVAVLTLVANFDRVQLDRENGTLKESNSSLREANLHLEDSARVLSTSLKSTQMQKDSMRTTIPALSDSIHRLKDSAIILGLKFSRVRNDYGRVVTTLAFWRSQLMDSSNLLGNPQYLANLSNSERSRAVIRRDSFLQGANQIDQFVPVIRQNTWNVFDSSALSYGIISGARFSSGKGRATLVHSGKPYDEEFRKPEQEYFDSVILQSESVCSWNDTEIVLCPVEADLKEIRRLERDYIDSSDRLNQLELDFETSEGVRFEWTYRR